jgi:hypothetical protein
VKKGDLVIVSDFLVGEIIAAETIFGYERVLWLAHNAVYSSEEWNILNGSFK